MAKKKDPEIEETNEKVYYDENGNIIPIGDDEEYQEDSVEDSEDEYYEEETDYSDEEIEVSKNSKNESLFNFIKSSGFVIFSIFILIVTSILLIVSANFIKPKTVTVLDDIDVSCKKIVLSNETEECFMQVTQSSQDITQWQYEIYDKHYTFINANFIFSDKNIHYVIKEVIKTNFTHSKLEEWTTVEEKIFESNKTKYENLLYTDSEQDNSNNNSPKNKINFYKYYYIIYIIFGMFVILVCLLLTYNTFSMNLFFLKLKKSGGHFSELSSKKNNRIDGICEAYKNSFIVSGDEDYHKTRANSDLYFGVDTWLQDLNILPLQTFLKIIPGTFIGFGILGTFIGFSEGLTQINVIDGDMQSITTGVQLLLDGLRNAFNTSIVGVLASVYLNFFVIHPLLNRINGISKQLCDYLDSKFYVTEVDAMAILDENHNTKPFPVVMNDMMAKLETVAANINHLGNTVGAQVTQSIKSTMDDTIESIIRDEINKLKVEFNSIIDTLKECSAQLQAAPQNLKESAGIMKDASNISITSFQQQSQESIAALTTTINENLNVKFESYLEKLYKIADTMAQINNSMDKMPENFVSAINSIESTSQKLVSNTNEFSKAFDVSTQILAQTTDITSMIVKSYQSQVDIIDNSSQKLEKVITESNQVTQNSKELLDGYTQVDEHLAKIFAEVNKNTEQYTKILGESLMGYFKQFQDATKDISKQFAEATMHLSEEIEKLNSIKD